MNFSTSSSSVHRRYVTSLCLAVLMILLVLFGVGVYLQPLYGDLTRVGFYSERDFGWNSPEEQFENPIYSRGPYDRFFDIVVLGDSFSTGRPNIQWQNHLAAKTGQSLVTLDINKNKLDSLLSSAIFRRSPPRLLIVELVERDLPLAMTMQQSCQHPASQPSSATSYDRHGQQGLADSAGTPSASPVQFLTSPMHRERRLRDIQLGFARDFLWHKALRQASNDLSYESVEIPLSTRAPFSSRVKNELLVYADDLRKPLWWTESRLAGLDCEIESMRASVERNGYTRFVLMVAPDKSTVYSDFAVDRRFRNLSLLGDLVGRHPETMPRLTLDLKRAVDRGLVDVYFPDDTHWSAIGNRIAASSLLAFLGTQRACGEGAQPPGLAASSARSAAVPAAQTLAPDAPRARLGLAR